jgi:tetratricopeptide (TPR) repeat protein
MSDDVIKAQDLVKRGEIDEAISIYQSMEPVSARVLNIIGVLFSEKKGDYKSAINYYERALQIQEEVHRQMFFMNGSEKTCFYLV